MTVNRAVSGPCRTSIQEARKARGRVSGAAFVRTTYSFDAIIGPFRGADEEVAAEGASRAQRNAEAVVAFFGVSPIAAFGEPAELDFGAREFGVEIADTGFNVLGVNGFFRVFFC